MITSSDLTPDREFTDSYGDVRRIIDVVEGRVRYIYKESDASAGFRWSLPVWKFLNYINGRTVFDPENVL